MRKINTIMLELLKLFPRYEFEKLEKRYNGNHYTKYFTGWQQLITLLFAQAGGKDSLREIETSLAMHLPSGTILVYKALSVVHYRMR